MLVSTNLLFSMLVLGKLSNGFIIEAGFGSFSHYYRMSSVKYIFVSMYVLLASNSLSVM